MSSFEHRSLRVHGCTRCGGAAYFDPRDEEWRCMLCSRLVPDPQPDRARLPDGAPRAA
jgi:hypothetical protein